MEFKKKTIIWEDNNEPPKDYIWVKKDGKFYEYSYTTRSWTESKSISGSNSEGSGGSSEDDGNLLMSLIPDSLPKPDLFLFKRGSADNNPIDVTNYKIDGLVNLCEEEEISNLNILCLYESSNLSSPIITNVQFDLGNNVNLSVVITRDNMINNEIVYNNKNYYYYFEELM